MLIISKRCVCRLWHISFMLQRYKVNINRIHHWIERVNGKTMYIYVVQGWEHTFHLGYVLWVLVRLKSNFNLQIQLFLPPFFFHLPKQNTDFPNKSFEIKIYSQKASTVGSSVIGKSRENVWYVIKESLVAGTPKSKCYVLIEILTQTVSWIDLLHPIFVSSCNRVHYNKGWLYI